MITSEPNSIVNTDILALSEYVPKNKFASSSNCPISDSEFNWIFKQRKNNGFAKAFVKFSARGFLVHIPTFIECLKAKQGV